MKLKHETKPSDVSLLPPLMDPILGSLVWNKITSTWVGTIRKSNGLALLNLGSGDHGQYPSEDILSLIREPYLRFQEISDTAQSYLPRHINLNSWGVKAHELIVTGLETHDYYLNAAGFTVTLIDKPTRSVWKVHFEKLRPIECGKHG